MKKTVLTLAALLCCCQMIFAQSATQNNPDNIFLSAYIPQPIDGIPEIAVSNLQNKLQKVIVSNGLGCTENQRFIVSANINLLSKDVTSTVPTQYAYILDVTFYLGDGFDGKVFATTSMEVKGVGETETKAYISAIKSIKEKNPQFKSFIESGKQKIIDYYVSNCDVILKEAQTYANTNNYEAAIATAFSIPMACTECYNKALDITYSFYKKMIDRDCALRLNEATALWNAGQSYDAAIKVAEILSTIEPESACFGDVKGLYNEVRTRVLEIDKREWNYTLKEQQQESERIEAIRAIGVAYGSHQQPTTVHYKPLW